MTGVVGHGTQCAGCGPCETVFSYSPSYIQASLFVFLLSCIMLCAFLALLCLLAANITALAHSAGSMRALLPAHHSFLQMVVVIYGCCFIRNLFLPNQNAAGLVGRALVDSGFQSLVNGYILALMYAKRSARHPFKICVICGVSAALLTGSALLFMELSLSDGDVTSASNVYWAVYDTVYLLCFMCTFLVSLLAHENNRWERCLLGYLTLSYLLMMIGDYMKIWKADAGFCIWLAGTGLFNTFFPLLCFLAFREDSRLTGERSLLLGVTSVPDEELAAAKPHRKWFTEYFDVRSPKYSGLGGDAALRPISVRDLRLERMVGQGSYGDVYKGSWQGLKVAVKKINLPEGDTRKADLILKDFVRELQVLTSIRHPNVLNVFGVCPESRSPAVVTEFMDRGSVFDMLGSEGDPSQLTDDRVLCIALDAAKGLLCLHTFDPPILHRDFKSGNLLVDSLWTAKVADFGLSRVKTLYTMTSSIGTVQWMAPEVLKGGKYSESADVYSFGVVLWEMISKKRPFASFHPMQLLVLMARQRMTLEFPEGHDGSSIHPEFPALARECMSHDAKARPDFHAITKRLQDMVRWRVECGLGVDPILLHAHHSLMEAPPSSASSSMSSSSGAQSRNTWSDRMLQASRSRSPDPALPSSSSPSFYSGPSDPQGPNGRRKSRRHRRHHPQQASNHKHSQHQHQHQHQHSQHHHHKVRRVVFSPQGTGSIQEEGAAVWRGGTSSGDEVEMEEEQEEETRLLLRSRSSMSSSSSPPWTGSDSERP